MRVKTGLFDTLILDKQHAEAKVENLEKTRYVENIEFVICSEIMLIIINLVLLRIAELSGNIEDRNRYLKRINIDFWKEYKKQYDEIKCDVLYYLDLASKVSILGNKDIIELKAIQEKKWVEIESIVNNSQKALEEKIPIYYRLKDDGSIVGYIPQITAPEFANNYSN